MNSGDFAGTQPPPATIQLHRHPRVRQQIPRSISAQHRRPLPASPGTTARPLVPSVIPTNAPTTARPSAASGNRSTSPAPSPRHSPRQLRGPLVQRLLRQLQRFATTSKRIPHAPPAPSRTRRNPAGSPLNDARNPGMNCSTLLFIMWQALVPITITTSTPPPPRFPALRVRVDDRRRQPGYPARARAGSPHPPSTPPARCPGERCSPGIFCSTTPPSRGSTALKNAREGYPVRAFHIALYPACKSSGSDAPGRHRGNGPRPTATQSNPPPPAKLQSRRKPPAPSSTSPAPWEKTTPAQSPRRIAPANSPPARAPPG
jgi:hypothetical protein